MRSDRTVQRRCKSRSVEAGSDEWHHGSSSEAHAAFDRGALEDRLKQPTPIDSREAGELPLRPGARLRWVLLGCALYAAARAFDSLELLRSDLDSRLAYLDPGSGSFMIQALVAMLAGIAVTIRAYWSKIREFFGAAPSGTESDDPGATSDDE